MNSKIEKSIIKFLVKEANLEELRELELWISNPKNETLFYEFIKTNVFINKTMSKYDKKQAKENIVRRIKQEKSVFYNSPKTNNLKKYAAAAILVGMLATSYFFIDNLFNTPQKITPVIVNNNIEIGTDKATLTLGDGSTISLEKGKSYQTKNVESNGEQIVYSQTKKSKSVIEYHYLTVPRGGEYFIKLPDGTQVWLNSESKLKYPEVFVEGETRKVELVYGEAYFDVSPSTLHKGAKFKVLNQSQEIEVLGTEFNIKAYKEETNIYTTLVEGKVTINFEGKKKSLVPSQQSNLNINSSILTVETVNVYNEISWKDGVFSFRRKPLVEIMQVLSRWYDLDVIFLNPEIKKTGFNGVLGKDQEIEDILLSIKNYGIIKDYKINGKKVVLE